MQKSWVTAALVFSAMLVIAQHAYAVDCTPDALGGTPLYVGGSTALGPFLRGVGPRIAAQAPPYNYVLVYTGGGTISTGSCDGVNGVVNPSSFTIADGQTLTYYPASFDPSSSASPPLCTQRGAKQLDLGISDVFVETCTSQARPADIGDFLGPAQAMLFVVPSASSQTAITAEEAYLIFGFGGTTDTTKQVQPWTDDNFMFIRTDSSGTKRILAATIGVPFSKWKGKAQGGSGAVFTMVAQSTAPEKTIGILGADFYDQGTNRTPVKALALRAFDQNFAYFADSTAASRDKRNLRDGHYLGLGYAHLIAKLTGPGGTVSNVGAKYFIDLILGNTVASKPAGYDPVKTIGKDAGLIPLCAMKVQRSAEGGELSPYAPTEPCGCYFESVVGTPSPDCVACSTTVPCSGGKTCRNGFCEDR